MKKASLVMNKIGKVFSILSFIFAPILIIVGAILLFATPEFIVEILAKIDFFKDAFETIEAIGIFFIVLGIFEIAFNICAIIFAGKANNAVNSGNKAKAPFVLTIVFGVLAESIFYVLGGIFGLVAVNQEEPVVANVAVSEEKPEDENKG